jgi:peptidoglycan/xylan/chitin deacetylase (PgdA/CDA1 family)
MSRRTGHQPRLWRSVALAAVVAAVSVLPVLAQEGTPPPLLPPAPQTTEVAPARTVEVSADEVVRGDPNRPRISLIVNVGAGHETAVSMLDTLKEKGLRTTFFVLGWWAERQPDILRRIAEDHEVASHGHSVFEMTKVSDAAVREDLERAEASISAVIGRTTKPLWSASAGDRDARVNRIAASMGYRPIYLTVDSLDWQYDSNGAIILTHFDSPTTVRSTALALPRLIDDLRARGYELVTITDLLTQ